jgi:microcompartment protein CcmK/EutM
MELGRVIGQVVSTVKQDGLTGFTLLVIQPHDARGAAAKSAAPYVAIDLVGAGNGEVVLLARGSGARIPSGAEAAPTDAAVVAIVDSVVVEGVGVYSKSG